jgi:predicted anti-sigma-YlaC factor YlaD
MNRQTPENCERIEALLPSFVEGGLEDGEAAGVRAHLESCAACRESLAAYAMIEESLVSRRTEVPAVESFLPDISALAAGAKARTPEPAAARSHAHPHLADVLRAMMSVPGIAIILVLWSAMLLLRFRDTVGLVFTWTSLDRLSAFTQQVQRALVGASGGDSYTLVGVYVALTLVLLASTGAITLRYVRN